MKPMSENEIQLKKWCIEQAKESYIKDDEGGGTIQAPLIKTAQEIYDWVTK